MGAIGVGEFEDPAVPFFFVLVCGEARGGVDVCANLL